MRTIALATALLATLLIASPLSAQEGGAPDLATRCEAVKFEHRGTDGDSLLPAGLVEIRDELRERGVQSLDDIEAAIPKSANLRRLVPFLVDEWPCDRTRALLIGLLSDREDFIASFAAFALGEVGGKEVVGPLIEAATKRPGTLRHNVLTALPGLGGLRRAGLELALTSTGDSEAWVRQSAYSCLESADWDKAIAEAIPALEEAVEFESVVDAKIAGQRALRVLRARSEK